MSLRAFDWLIYSLLINFHFLLFIGSRVHIIAICKFKKRKIIYRFLLSSKNTMFWRHLPWFFSYFMNISFIDKVSITALSQYTVRQNIMQIFIVGRQLKSLNGLINDEGEGIDKILRVLSRYQSLQMIFGFGLYNIYLVGGLRSTFQISWPVTWITEQILVPDIQCQMIGLAISIHFLQK